jgi:hypothetical protein
VQNRRDPRNKNNTIAGVIVSAFFAILGGGIFFSSVNWLLKAEASKKWAPIIGSAASVTLHSPRRGSPYRTIRYRYAYNGKSYENDRISYSTIVAGQGHVPRSAGDPVTVYVNPQAPDESVLAPGIAEGTGICCAIAAAVCIFGLSAVVVIVRERIQRLPHEQRTSSR